MRVTDGVNAPNFMDRLIQGLENTDCRMKKVFQHLFNSFSLLVFIPVDAYLQLVVNAGGRRLNAKQSLRD